MTEYRLYSIVPGLYLSDIQKGIQTAHLVHELFTKYAHQDDKQEEYQKLLDWADDHKTIIVLSGNDQDGLENYQTTTIPLLARKYRLPYGKFHESKSALNGCMTAVGLVVPDFLYNQPEYTFGEETDLMLDWKPMAKLRLA